MQILQNKEDVQAIFESIGLLYQEISLDLPFDKRKSKHKLWYEQLEDLFSSLHNCKILENPSTNTILTAALVLIPENALGKNDKLTFPNTIYIHLQKDMRIRLEIEDSYYDNNILEKDSIDTYEVMLEKIKGFIEKYQL